MPPISTLTMSNPTCCASPLRLFLTDLLSDASIIPDIVVDNARTSAPLPVPCMVSTASSGLNHASHHGVHRWDTVETSPTISNSNRKKPSSVPLVTKSSINKPSLSILTSAPIAPPGRSGGGLPPKPSTPPQSSFGMPCCPIRLPSKEPSICSGGSADSFRTPPGSTRTHRYSQSRNIVPPLANSNNKGNNNGTGSNNVSNYQEPYSPIRTLSPQQQLTRKLSETFAFFTSNLADTSSPILSPVRRLSRTLGIHHRQGGAVVSAVSSQPPTIPIRKPSTTADGTPLSPPYLPVQSKKKMSNRLHTVNNIQQVQHLQRKTSSILSNSSSSSGGSSTGSVNIQPPKRRMSTIPVGSALKGGGTGGKSLPSPLPGPPSALTRKASVVYGSSSSSSSLSSAGRGAGGGGEEEGHPREYTITPEDHPTLHVSPSVMPSPPRTRTSPMTKVFQRAKSTRR